MCFEAILQQNKKRNLRNVLRILHERPQLKKMLVITSLSVCLLILWLSQAVASRHVFQNYFGSMDAWLRCIRFDFARHAALGEAWKEEILVDIDGGLCPASPTGTGLFTSNLLKSMFETLLPLMVAITFSWRLVGDARRKLQTPKRLQACLPTKWLAAKNQVVPMNLILPHHGANSGAFSAFPVPLLPDRTVHS